MFNFAIWAKFPFCFMMARMFTPCRESFENVCIALEIVISYNRCRELVWGKASFAFCIWLRKNEELLVMLGLVINRGHWQIGLKFTELLCSQLAILGRVMPQAVADSSIIFGLFGGVLNASPFFSSLFQYFKHFVSLSSDWFPILPDFRPRLASL